MERLRSLSCALTQDGNLELRDNRFHQADAALSAEVERLKLQTERLCSFLELLHLHVVVSLIAVPQNRNATELGTNFFD